MRWVKWIAVVLVAAVAGPSEGRTVTNQELNYTLVVPDWLQPIATSPAMPAIFAAYATSDPSEGLPDVWVTVARLGGIIGQGHLDPTKIPGITGVKVFQRKWKTFDLEVFEGHLATGGLRVTSWGAQIPLRREAIQINVCVPEGKEARADALLGELLAGLDGPSNWLSDTDRAERLGELTVYVAVLVIAVIVVIRARRRRSRQREPAPSGEVDG
jgi:hypothetical protein